MLTDPLEELFLSKDQFMKFLHTIPKYHTFHGEFKRKPQMTPFEWQIYFCILYYTCIRPGAEAKRLTKGDFQLDTRILHIPNRKGGFAKTTLPPPLLPILEIFLRRFKDGEILFKPSRQTFWTYTKQIGELAGIKYFEEFEKRQTKGLYTYVFKHAYIQRLEFENCPGSLISIKSRHKPDTRAGMAQITINYAKSLRGLKIWEAQNITEVIDIYG